MEKKKEFEVIVAQQSGDKARVIHKEFNSYAEALGWALIICNDDRTVKCSIWRMDCLVMDML